MIDLHTHTLFSDGELLPSELVRRAVVKGYKAIGLADHVDASNVDFVIPRLVKVAKELNSVWNIKVIPAAELTHIPLEHIKKIANEARRLGAKLIIVHGETVAEPVLPGTNKTALLSNIDILAHPGKITEEEIELAIKRDICLEITARTGHSQTNKHLIQSTKNTQARLILNTDTHAPEDLLSEEEAKQFLLALSLSEEEQNGIFLNSQKLISKL